MNITLKLYVLVLTGCISAGCALNAPIVKVVDESSTPLAGVRCYPTPMYYTYQISDEKGRLRVFRNRKFILFKEGYLQEWREFEPEKEAYVLRPGSNDLISEVLENAGSW